MDKDKRFEMRLPSPLYVRLRGIADERGSSVAELLREGGERLCDGTKIPQDERMISAQEQSPRMEAIEARPVGSTPTPSAEIRTDSKETAEFSLGPLTRQLQNQGYTKPVAERMAREKLGLKS